MSGPAYINVSDVNAFYLAMKRAINDSPDWRKARMGKMGGLTADYIGDAFTGEDLGVAFLDYADERGRVRVTLHARSWGTDQKYHDVEGAILSGEVKPLVKVAGRALGFKLVLRRPKEKVMPLRGKLAETFAHFTDFAPRHFQGGLSDTLHPFDQQRYWRFIRMAHQYNSVLRPSDVCHHLQKAGFTDKTVERLSGEYRLGRRVLAGQWDPWERRARRLRARAERWREAAGAT